jgi:hypothetical protein
MRKRNKAVAILSDIGIILFAGEEGQVLTKNLCCKGAGSSRKRDPQSPSRESTGSFVSRRELFRPARSGSGQIRNAAPGSERDNADQPCRYQLRFFSSCFLQSATGFCSRGSGGTHSQTPQPQRSTQADRRDFGVCRANPRSRAIYPNSRAGSADSERVCHSGAPSKLGASVGGCEKKPSTP